MKPRHVTIKDLAKALDLSVATISRAFNDKYDIKKETRELILKKADELGYKPNPIAKKLIQQRSFNIGVVVPEFITSFFPKVLSGIQEVLIAKGYQVLIMETGESCERELEVIKTLEESMVDGMLISLSKETHNVDYINKLITNGLPVVLFNRVSEDIMAPKVLFDDYKWAFFATERLIEAGYKNIFHYAAPSSLSLSKKRINGFVSALKKHGLLESCEQVIETGFTIQDGEAITEKLLDEGKAFDAIFSSNDRSAIGAIRVLKRRGYKIPEEIGIMGFSESSLATVVEPELSSVEQPTTKMGRVSAELLLRMIDSETNEQLHDVVLGGKIHVRESSMK